MSKEKKNKASHKPVPLAIVGIGCLFPKARDAKSYWTNIRDGVDAITEIPDTHWKPEDYFDSDKNAPDMTYARRGGFLDPVDFDPLLYGLSPNNIEATDTTQLLGMVVARQALLDAGYATGKDSNDGRDFDRDRTSVILGVTGTLELVIPLGARLGHPIWRKALADAGVEQEVAEDVVQRISEGYVPWQENSFPGLLGNVAAGRIANRFDLGGTNCVVDAACASSLSAVHMAALELYSGRSDMAITGGFDTFNDIFMYMCFSKTPALSPTGNSKPFDHNGDGTILGEGLGAVILKRLDDAQRDGDKIYAVIKSIGSSSDGKGNAIYAPSANGQTKALNNAYREADVSPGSIELVEAHGTGTKVGDAVEAEALSGVYREDKAEGSWCAIGSVKSMIGHTKAAAGVAGLIKVAMALQSKVLPPTIKVEQPLDILEPGSAPVYVNANKRPWIGDRSEARRGALSAFGFGGSNFHCVLEEAEPVKPEIEWDGQVLLFSFAGDSKNTLQKQLQQIDSEQKWEQLRAAAARSRQTFNIEQEHRLMLVVTPETDLAKLLSSLGQMLQQDKASWETPDGAYYSSVKEVGKLAMLFPGQGAQYCNMLLDLACQFPQMQQSLVKADELFTEVGESERLSDLIYPISRFTDEARQLDEDHLRATQHAQPAIGTSSLGAYEIFKHFGIQADITAGHSFGELTALYAAGRIDADSLYKLAMKRGELMQMDNADHGSMLAVSASAAVVHEFLEAEPLDVIIANNNAPKQVVLSGATEQIDKAATQFEKRGFETRRLPVAAAFHSSYVADAEKPFTEFLQDIEFQQGEALTFANSTAEAYPDDANEARSLLGGQLARPVEFVPQIENIYEAGARTFIEVGPGNILTGLVKSILSEQTHRAIALDASRGKRKGQYDLACLLAQLTVSGHKVELTAWDPAYLDTYQDESNKKPAMTIPLSGANYVKERPQRAPAPKRTNTIGTNTMSEEAVPATNKTQATTQGSTNGNALLQATQQSILALQKMQEQTAKLHQQYLEGQETAQRSIQQLIQQQQQILAGVPLANTVIPTPPPVQQPKVPVVEVQAPVQNEVQQAAAVVAPVTTESKEDHEYENLLLEVVAEKTGYPVEMLSMDMSLDTDLGIDSIKRVEILSALQERLPGVQKIQPEDLGTFQLLKHIVEFLAADADVTSVAAATPAVAASAVDNSKLRTVLLEVVAEKTGYPEEMLNLDMNLDTDLGIDSIKRVEILSAFQEKMPEAPTVNPEDLATLQTLQQIVDFMQVNTAPSSPAKTETSTAIANDKFQTVLLEVVADKTGYPAEMLNLDMNLDTDLGIDSIKRVEILSAFQEKMPEAPAVNPEDLAALQTLQQIVEHMQGSAPQQAVQSQASIQEEVATVENVLYRSVVEANPLQATYPEIGIKENSLIYVTDDGSDLPEKICKALEKRKLNSQIISINEQSFKAASGLIVLAPKDADDEFLQSAFNLVQASAKTLRESGKQSVAILAGITRLGGSFGVQDLSSVNVEAGGLAGLTKTADKEWSEVNCKTIDIPANRSSIKLASSIVEEILQDGPLEVGIKDNSRITLSLNTQAVDLNKESSNPFTEGDVVVVTGGARGVTAKVAIELAKTYGVNLLLLGRTPMPGPEPEWLVGVSEEADIKKAILSNRGEQQTPKEIDETYRRILAKREILATLEKIKATGVNVTYEAIDVRDSAAVGEAVNRARDSLGNVAGIFHGAGVLADRLIEDKTIEQFQQVYETKVAGLRALIKATEKDDLKVMVLFSSSTARFGRKGQVDYAMANEVLNKIAQQQQQLRPACRVISANWGPWDGGMVTPQLKKLFESEGVGVISLQAGTDYLMQEIAEEGPVELVLLGSEPQEQNKAPLENRNDNAGLSLAFERRLSIEEYPVLKSHVMNGKAVLPAALIAEWLAHGAIHNNPGLSFIGINDLSILKGVILEPGESIDLQIMTSHSVMQDDEDLVAVELHNGDVLHARAEIVLGHSYPDAPQNLSTAISGSYPFTDGEYYKNDQLFHGTDLQGIESIQACSDLGIVGQVKTAPAPSSWMAQPIRSSWLADPLILDSAFQMMILWSFQNSGVGSLPTKVGRYRQFQRRFPKNGVKLFINVESSSKHASTAIIDFVDEKEKLIARIDGYECVIDASLNDAFKRNQLEQAQA